MLSKTEDNFKKTLTLSRWDSKDVPVFIRGDVSENLKNYHVMGIRFLYNCFYKNQKGAILNHEDNMNFQIQIAAFFNALSCNISPRRPVLIVSSEKCMSTWLYHLTVHGGFEVSVLSAENYEQILEEDFHRVILACIDDTQLLREIKDVDFFSVVVDEFDLVATKMIVKQLSGRFNIGLTTRNFIKCPDQKLFWTMLNWSNAGVVGKFAEFCEEDRNHLVNLRNPYRSWWQRLTWKFCDNFKAPTVEEQKEYKRQVKEWLSNGDIALPRADTKRTTRKTKRKAPLHRVKIECKQEDEEPERAESSNALGESASCYDLPNNKYPKRENDSFPNDSPHDTKDNLNLNRSPIDSSCNDNVNQNNSQISNSSQGTIIYEHQDDPSSSDVDENPILSAVISSSSDLIPFDKISHDMTEVDEDDDILMSIINN